jgi:hypothetical protein
MFFRKYLVSVVILSLLIWGPLDHSWPAWLAIRIGYLIVIPLIVWFAFKWIWNLWEPTEKVENKLERILSASVCIALLIFAIIRANTNTHWDNTKWIRTRDGTEAVGEDILVNGPDWLSVFILILFAGLVLWYGVLKKGIKKQNLN